MGATLKLFVYFKERERLQAERKVYVGRYIGDHEEHSNYFKTLENFDKQLKNLEVRFFTKIENYEN